MSTSLFILTVTLLLSPSVICDLSFDGGLFNVRIDKNRNVDFKIPEGEQPDMSNVIDKTLADIVGKMRDENQGKIDIPDLEHKFSTGFSIFKTTGLLKTFNGTFEDLTTLSRTENAVLSNEGLKFVGSCGFGLSYANIDYEHYKVRYGIIKVNGKLSTSIDGVSISAQLSVDYNQKPCRPVLEKVKVTELGKVKVSVTGLGVLNKLASNFASWMITLMHDKIVTKVEDKLRDLVESNFDKINCEAYRP